MEKHFIAIKINAGDKLSLCTKLNDLGYTYRGIGISENAEEMYVYCNCSTKDYELPLSPPPSEYQLIKSIELFLALATRTDNENGGLYEHWIYCGSNSVSFTQGKIYIQRKKNITDNECFNDNTLKKNGFSSKNKEKFRKATFDEIVAHYTGKPMTPKFEYTGDLKGFPRKALLFLEKQQKAAGNKVDLSVFDRDIFSGDSSGGFNWKNIGVDFTRTILINREFDLLDENGNIIKWQCDIPTKNHISISGIDLIKDIPQHHEEPVKLITSFKPLNISSDEEV